MNSGRVPLDLLRGFEAAARHLSFTRAGEELHLTQSAVSRQIKALEERLGVALFVRQTRALLLTREGQELHRAAADALRLLGSALERISRERPARQVSVTTSMAFASLWLIPRLSQFRARHPDIDVRISANNQVLDLGREQIDLAIRYCGAERAPRGAVRLFGEDVLPVCAPSLLEALPIAHPADLARHVLLHFDDPEQRLPWLDWAVWLEAAGVPGQRGAGSLRFSHYDQVVRAALDGQGVALGRHPLVKRWLREGALAAPFGHTAVSERAYYLVQAAGAARRQEALQFVNWLREEAHEPVATRPAQGPDLPTRRAGRKRRPPAR